MEAVHTCLHTALAYPAARLHAVHAVHAGLACTAPTLLSTVSRSLMGSRPRLAMMRTWGLGYEKGWSVWWGC